MEGTTIGRTGTDEGFATESDLEREFVQAFKETKGLHFVWTSSQNIDRLVTIFRAAKWTGRVLLIDLYTAVVLEATGRDSIPQSDWDEVRLYTPHRQRVTIKEKGLFLDLGRHKANRVFSEDLPGLASRAVMLFRPMMMSDKGVQLALGRRSVDLFDVGRVPEAGRLGQGPQMARRARHREAALSTPRATRLSLTSSASPPPLRLANWSRYIHSRRVSFGDFFEDVVQKEDGEWWTV